MSFLARRYRAVARLALALCLVTAACTDQAPPPGGEPATCDEVSARCPNVLVIVTDDQRLDTLEVMPSLRRWFADAGTTYPNAYSNIPICCPARATLMTGRFPHNHGVTSNFEEDTGGPALDPATTIQRTLDDAGYETGIVGKYLNGVPLEEDPPYFDSWAVSRGDYDASKWNVNGEIQRRDQHEEAVVQDLALDFLTRSRSAPFYLYVAPKAPHPPFVVEDEHKDGPVPAFRPSPAVTERDRSDKPGFVRDVPPIGVGAGREIRSAQLRLLMSVDDLVDALFEQLQRAGQLEDTLVLFLSDNGMFWGEHGLRGKWLPYLASVRIPLFVRWPAAVERPERDARLVGLTDVVPTILDVLGMEDEELDGRSLLDEWERDALLLEFWKTTPREHTPGTPVRATWASLTARDYQYTEYYDDAGKTIGFREYYDLRADPFQLRNLLADGRTPAEVDVDRLSRTLAEARSCRGSSCP